MSNESGRSIVPFEPPFEGDAGSSVHPATMLPIAATSDRGRIRHEGANFPTAKSHLREIVPQHFLAIVVFVFAADLLELISVEKLRGTPKNAAPGNSRT
jgi:hypothetical protein